MWAKDTEQHSRVADACEGCATAMQYTRTGSEGSSAATHRGIALPRLYTSAHKLRIAASHWGHREASNHRSPINVRLLGNAVPCGDAAGAARPGQQAAATASCRLLNDKKYIIRHMDLAVKQVLVQCLNTSLS